MSYFLLFDIGNTDIKIGIANEKRIIQTYSLRTDAWQTPDSLGLSLLTLLGHANIALSDIRACVASSVVPAMIPLLKKACKKYVHCQLLCILEDITVPINNAYGNAHEVGADRLVVAYSARMFCPEPESLICVDFGTATVFDCITGKGAAAKYVGGLIFPGVHAAASALSNKTAKLPMVNLEIDVTEPQPGLNTTTSINHGIIFGFASLVEGLTARLKKQLPGELKIIATGGFANDVSRVSKCFDHVNQGLLLDGLRQLYVNYLSTLNK